MANSLWLRKGNTLGEAARSPGGDARRTAGNSGSIRSAGVGAWDFGELLPFVPPSAETYECK